MNLNNVFSNQNLFICKREKNFWSNSHFLVAKPINIEKNNSNNAAARNNNESEKIKEKNYFYNNFILDFNEGQGQAFQVKVCSNYIDPSSSNLSFATPVWLVVQSVERYLNIVPLPKI